MNDRLVRFPIPVDFIAPRVSLRATELAYGLSEGWLAARDVVSLVRKAAIDGRPLSKALEEITLLFDDDLDEVPRLLAADTDQEEDASEVWLFLSLAWLFDHREEFPDPLGVIEMLFADFGYPEQMIGLVRYMPVVDSAPGGVEAIERRWATFLDECARAYLGRDVA